MTKVILMMALLFSVTSVAAQLPPEILADKYLLEAKMLSEEKDHKGALEAMDRIVALQKEHQLTLPEEFSFQYAQTALAAGSVQAAIDSANRYLTAVGREGKPYREALELLVKAERRLQEPNADRAETGTAKPEIEPQLLARLPSAPVAQGAADARPVVDCRKWNTTDYFQTASVESVTACLAAGADPRALDKWKNTPLHMAARSNENPAVIETLLKAGSDPKARSDDKETPLHYASRWNENPGVIKALLKAGADPNKRQRDGKTPLHVAAWHNENPGVTEALLRGGADPNKRLRGGETPLHYAALGNENPAVIEALLRSGADPNVRDGFKRTPLHFAAGWNENPAVVQELLEAAADPMAKNIWNDTPLDDAKTKKNINAIEVLRDPKVVRVRQLGAARSRRRSKSGSGPSFLDFTVGIAGGTAIAAAGGGTDEAMKAGTVFTESVIAGQPSGESIASAPTTDPASNSGSRSTAGPCLIPNFPNHDPKADIEIPWCPSGGPQVESFAGMAVVYQCSLSVLEDPEKIREVRRRVAEYCKRLDAMKQLGGDWHCQCPPGFGQ